MCSQGAGHALVTRINQSKKKVEGRRERQAGEQRRRREDVVRRRGRGRGAYRGETDGMGSAADGAWDGDGQVA